MGGKDEGGKYVINYGPEWGGERLKGPGFLAHLWGRDAEVRVHTVQE